MKVVPIIILLLICCLNIEAQQITIEDIIELAEIKNDAELANKTKAFVENEVVSDSEAIFLAGENALKELMAKGDTVNALKVFNYLSTHYYYVGTLDSAFQAFDTNYISKKDIPIQVLASFYYKSGLDKEGNGDITAAKTTFEKALNYFETLADSAYSEWVDTYYNLGGLQSKENNFAAALANYKKALELARSQNNDESFVSIQAAISDLYSLNYLFEEAYKAREEIILLAKKRSDFESIVVQNLNFSLNEKMQNRPEQQKQYLDEALVYADSSEDSYVQFIVYYSYFVYLCQNNRTDSLDYFYNQIETIYPSYQDYTFMQLLYLDVTAYYNLQKNNLTTAKRIALEKLALAETYNEKEIIIETHELLSRIYKATGEVNKANKEESLMLQYQDAAKLNALKNQLIFYKTIYETETQDLKIKTQKSEIKLLNAQNKLNRNLFLFAVFGVLTLASIIYLFRSRKFAKQREAMQYKFTQDIIKSVEQERKRISGELHDSIGQSLLLIKNKIFLSKQKTEDIELVDDAIHEVREISQALHPYRFEEQGLVNSLRNIISKFQANSTIFYSDNFEEVSNLPIKEEHQIFVYRMLQECLNNVEKHSKAKACNLSIEIKKNTVLFTVRDNGIGFDLTEGRGKLNSLGMKTLKERAQIVGGQLLIDSIKDKGTVIQISIPKV